MTGEPVTEFQNRLTQAEINLLEERSVFESGIASDAESGPRKIPHAAVCSKSVEVLAGHVFPQSPTRFAGGDVEFRNRERRFDKMTAQQMRNDQSGRA